MRIVVGSTKQLKIDAALLAFQQIFPDEVIKVQGYDVSSGIPHQPMSDEEAIQGARNRAHAAMKLSNADYALGLEAGIQQIEKNWYNCGWVVIINQKGEEGIASGIKIQLPQKFIDEIHAGKELGDVVDDYFKRKNAKLQEGYFGIMTNNHITRKQVFKDAVIVAMARFLHPELF